MDVVKYLRRIISRWREIALVTAIVTISVGAVTLAMPKSYTSSATYFITSKGSDVDTNTALAAGSLAQQKIVAYAAVASSEAMAVAVIDDLGLDISPFDLRQKVTATNTFGTALVVVTVTDQSAQRALAIAESIGSNYDPVLAEVDSSSADGRLNVVASMLVPPQLPTSPSSPYVLLNIIAALASGLFLGVAIAAIRDLLDTRISTAEDLQNLVEVSVVGTIPDDRGLATNPVAIRVPDSVSAEDFRRLRLNLKSLPPGRCRTIAVTSAFSGEGKTVVATNLAAALGELDATVCLVDANLRDPQIAEAFGLAKDAAGLTSLVLEQAAFDSAQHDGGGQLKVIPAGPPATTPSAVLGSTAFRDVLQKLRESFDFIIIDTSALSVASDALAVASETDATLLVVRRGRTTESAVHRSTDSLRKVEAHLQGVVLNRVPVRRRAVLSSR